MGSTSAPPIQTQSSKPTSASKEAENKPVATGAEALTGSWASAPPAGPPSASTNNNSGSAQLKSSGAASFGQSISKPIQAKSENAVSPSGDVKADMGQSMGADFSNVNFHTNSSKASEIGAQAYTQGSDVHFAPGKFNPSSSSGKELIGHELTHVVQQREGRVQATTQAKGIPVNDDSGLEKEADVAGAKAARGEAAPVQRKANNATTIGPMPLQRKAEVAQLEGGEGSESEGEEVAIDFGQQEAEAGEVEDPAEEAEVPIPPFPAYSPDASSEGPEEQAPTLPGPKEVEQAPPLPPRPKPKDVEQAPPLPPRPKPKDVEQAPPLPPRPAPKNVEEAPPLPPRPKPKDVEVAPPLPPRPKPKDVDVAPPLPPRPAPKDVAPSDGAPPLPPRPAPKVSSKANPGVAPSPSGEDRVNYNADNKQDYTEYGILGVGGAAAGASAATKSAMYGDTFAKGAYDFGSALNGKAPTASAFGETASAVSGLGVAGGALGTIGAVADGVRAGEMMADSNRETSDRAIGGGGAMLSAAGSGLKESSSMTFHAANLAGNAAVAGSAALLAGAGSVAMGAADVLRGGYNLGTARAREDRLNLAAQDTDSAGVLSAATQAASTQVMRGNHAKGTIFKGLLLIAGGTTLILMGSNPIGWGLLAGAAIVGGITSLRRFLAKKARKKEVAIRELGVEKDYATYLAAKKTHSKFNRQAKVPIPPNPLDREMESHGYKPKEYGKFYADYIHDTAWIMYNLGVLGDQRVKENSEMRGIITDMGLKVVQGEAPLPAAIASALHK